MFSKSAKYYDLIYSFKDYKEEARQISDLIKQKHPSAKTVLDVACGTGEHARFLSNHFDIDGIDIEPELIRMARAKLPKNNFLVADMQNFDLGKQYDIVQCLFSSIGYMSRPEEVVAALRCLKKHLHPNGLVIVEPWFTPKDWVPGSVHIKIGETEELKVCRMSTSEVKGCHSKLRFHYLVGKAGSIEHFTEDHTLGLYTVEEMRSFFREAGLKVEYDPLGIFGRGIYYGSGI